jgi:ABC-type amino acid transport substrate-binding protein
MRFYILLTSCLLSLNSWAVEIVKVGVYDFPPYVFVGDKTTGITTEMIAAMNQFQNKYEFVAVPTTAKRRYSDFEKNKFDLIIFENKNWGWQQFPVDASHVFASGHEVYVTKVKAGREQEFFADFNNKAMIAVRGYHYQFTDLDNTKENNLNVFLSDSQEKSLELILNDRGEIAVLSMEYLNFHFYHYPADKEKLLISDKFDQVYQHTILVRRGNKLTVQYINTLLDTMKKKGALKPIWQHYGIEDNQ